MVCFSEIAPSAMTCAVFPQIAPSATTCNLCCVLSDCPICYNLVQDRVNIHRGKLHDLRELIRQINDNPKVVDDSDFRAKLDSTAATVDDLLEEARKTGGEYIYIGVYCIVPKNIICRNCHYCKLCFCFIALISHG